MGFGEKEQMSPEAWLPIMIGSVFMTWDKIRE
jgi:hypothetical protein